MSGEPMTDQPIPPIMAGSALAEAMLVTVRQVSMDMPPDDRAQMWHGLCAAVFGTMSAHIGFDAANWVIAKVKDYGEIMRAEQNATGGMH